MNMAMAWTIKSDMSREIESVTENHLGKREAESKQVGIKKGIMSAEEKEKGEDMKLRSKAQVQKHHCSQESTLRQKA